MQKILNYFESHMFSCAYKKYFGIECPGCGFQRSLYYLLKGDFKESFQAYPPLIPILVMFMFLTMHFIFKFRYGAKILMFFYISNSLLIIINYIIKLSIN
jgi:hypothetical protein